MPCPTRRGRSPPSSPSSSPIWWPVSSWVETAFAYPGLGRLMVDSVAVRDIPIVQACGLIFCAFYFAVNLAADIVAMLCNPRLRQRR